jgi:hypothetical protein
MAAETNTASSSQSFAEQLAKKHGHAHTASVEEVPDEEDILHPPPSMKTAVAPAPEQPTEPLSEKAQGKKKAEDAPASTKNGIDTRSEEAFPALGGGPKPQATGPTAPTWGAKKPSTSISGPGFAAPQPASRGSNAGGQAPVSLPGRHSEQVVFAPEQLAKRTELKKSVPEILRDINKRSKAKVELKHGLGGKTIFEGTGPVDAVRQALKDVAKEVGSKQSIKIPIPLSVRPHIIGRQGATIQDIQRKTGARVNFPKQDELPAGIENDEDATIDVTIEGDAVSAELARSQIQHCRCTHFDNECTPTRDSGRVLPFPCWPTQFAYQ